MKFHALLKYKGNVVGCRFEHKGAWYDIDNTRMKEYGVVVNEQSNELELIPVGKHIMTEDEARTKRYATDLTDNMGKFELFMLEEKAEQARLEFDKYHSTTPKQIEKPEVKPEVKEEIKVNQQKEDVAKVDKPKTTEKPSVKVSEVEPTTQVDKPKSTKDAPAKTKATKNTKTTKSKKELSPLDQVAVAKPVLSKGVAYVVLEEDYTTGEYDNASVKRTTVMLLVSNKTAIGKLNSILGAKFEKTNRLKDFESGKKNFKVVLNEQLLKELEATFECKRHYSAKHGVKVKFENDFASKSYSTKISLKTFTTPKDYENELYDCYSDGGTLKDYIEKIKQSILDGNSVYLTD